VGAASGLLAQNITPFSDPATFFSGTTLGLANGIITGALIGSGIPPAIATPLIGGLNAGLSNLAVQAIHGRKPINVCSAAGAAIGGVTGGALRAVAQAGLAGAPIPVAAGLAGTVTNAIGSSLTIAHMVGQPFILSQLGKQACN
jgi:hypothetical protein